MPKDNTRLKQSNFEAIRDHIFDRFHKTGEQVKNDLPNVLRTAIKTKAWLHFNDLEGKPFKNIVDWLQCTYPNGTSMGQGRNVITYEEALKLTEGHSDVHKALATHVPRRDVGRPKKGNAASTQHFDMHSRTNTKTGLSLRMSRDFPAFYNDYLNGKYKTITAAAIAAKLIKDDGNIRRAKSAFRKMTEKEKKEFVAWMKTDDAKK